MLYDHVVREQLAGDELTGRTDHSVIATGMLRAGTWNDEPNDPQEYIYERLEARVDVVSTAFLGITVRCARCHDHKFDPIPQRDYYRLAGAFWPGAIEPRDGKLMGGPSESELGVKGVFGWTDIRKDPAVLHLLENGEIHRKAEVVAPGFLSLVPVLDVPMNPPRPEWKTTRRRAQLAGFIVDRRNPLTRRHVERAAALEGVVINLETRARLEGDDSELAAASGPPWVPTCTRSMWTLSMPHCRTMSPALFATRAESA